LDRMGEARGTTARLLRYIDSDLSGSATGESVQGIQGVPQMGMLN